MIVFHASVQAVTRSAIFLNRSTGGRQEVILPLTISDRIFKNEIVTLVVYINIKENLDRGPREDYPARG